MNIYVIDADIDYGTVVCDDSRVDLLRWSESVGSDLRSEWLKPSIGFYPKYRGQRFIPLDCVHSMSPIGRGLLVNDRARSVMEPVLGDTAQFLNVEFEGYSYWWLNCLKCLDILDFDKSVGERSEIGPKIRDVTRWAFNNEVARNASPMFLVNDGYSHFFHYFCTDTLASAIHEAGLTGFDIYKIWSSEAGPVDEPRSTTISMSSDNPLLFTKDMRKAVLKKRRDALKKLGL